jgi:predicted nucleic-acid-binding protein
VIAVDTNIVVRLLTRDDETQFQASRRLFAESTVFIADTVILETEWVLRHAYDVAPDAVCQALRKLFGLAQVQLNQPRLVAQALDWHEQGLDFADAFHLALSQQHSALKTFDGKFIRRAASLTACAVELP